jgi:signal transduction histidine kinase
MVGGTFGWLAHREVEQALRVSGTERATSAADQVADLLGQSVTARVAELRRLAADPLVHDAVRSPAQAGSAGQPPALQDYLRRNQQSTVSLYDVNGSRVARWSRESGTPAAGQSLSEDVSITPTEQVSPLRSRGGRLSYAVIVKIAGDASGTPVGYLSMQRSLGSASTTGLIERLIGAGAAIKVGNASGDVWTDLSGPVTAPPLSGEGSRRYASNGEMRLGASSPIPGTPWLVWADISEASVLRPARMLVNRMLPITLTLALLGTLAVYIVSGRVTRPLEQVAMAAQAVAAGDYSRRVDIPRRDEIGRLGLAFNVMAERVGESHVTLEARIRARTEELEAFSYSVSHDLRAPLRHISGFAGLLRKDAWEHLPEASRRHVDTIIEAGKRASRLVDDLLSFSRMSRAEMHHAAVDLDAVVRDAVAEQSRDVEGRDVDWVLAPLPRLPGDQALLKVAIANLISNAVKYTSTRTRARIEVGALPATNGERVLFVRDNGVGFDMQYSDKLFGVFQRLHSAEEFEGTGIGLANVRRIVHRHGGRTWAEGSPGHGATFYVSLPTQTGAR